MSKALVVYEQLKGGLVDSRRLLISLRKANVFLANS